MNPELQQRHNEKLQHKYREVEKQCVSFEQVLTEDAEVIFVAFGISSRICMSACGRCAHVAYVPGCCVPRRSIPSPERRLLRLQPAGDEPSSSWNSMTHDGR